MRLASLPTILLAGCALQLTSDAQAGTAVSQAPRSLQAAQAAVGTATDAKSVGSPAAMAPSQDWENRCTALKGRKLAGGSIITAEFVPVGTILPPFKFNSDVAFCRLDARTSSGPGSKIEVAVYLPSRWNGKLAGIGGAGFEGGSIYAAMALPFLASRGYAGVTTNGGHDPTKDPKWALEPAKIADYGHRANHLGAVLAKALVAEYYGRQADRAYFRGCSNGGRDALMLAQRYPEDYDAIAVGAPANDFTGLMSSFARTGQVVRSSGIDFSPAKLKLLNDAVIRRCDGRDGVLDGVIERPQACRFDPAVLQCRPGAATDDCLTKGEVDLAKALHRGFKTGDGHQLMPGLPVGSEYEWHTWLTSRTAQGPSGEKNFFGYMLYKNPNWDSASFDLDRDYALARRTVGREVDAIDPDLRPFLSRGGKLMMYHGWDDAAIPAGNTIQYFEAMRQTVGPQLARQTRLFMLPGVAHCWGGTGPNAFDPFGELDRWVTSGRAPDRIVVSKVDNPTDAALGVPFQASRTRPACAWPKAARYKGTGSTDAAENFVCK